MDGIDFGLIRHALEKAKEHGYAHVELETAIGSFEANFGPKKPLKTKPKVKLGEGASAKVAQLLTIKSASVGYFGAIPSTPNLGDKVTAGDVVGIVSVLGLAQDVTTKHDGYVKEVRVSDGDTVEYGQILFALSESPVVLVETISSQSSPSEELPQ